MRYFVRTDVDSALEPNSWREISEAEYALMILADEVWIANTFPVDYWTPKYDNHVAAPWNGEELARFIYPM